ncbi:MAG: hypothetical protein K6G13_08845 [Agathobacter sp.]|uniref:hypothetical protein n=1 Tax=Agathobacter sp. TaxID=2021311 RepID=UPI00258AC624|nr:hypothetical protein [Agathobacter sp.]MCR5678122.1 hypothetical protein [Agathobacter sp.]
MNTLVTYFSVGGTTKKIAEEFAAQIGKTVEKLAPYVEGAASVDAKLVHNVDEIKNW